MNILLTNDDGIDAKGLRKLYDCFKKANHNVAVCAPLYNQSGKGHSITVRADYEVRKDKDYEYGVGGTPADCVLFFQFSGEFEGFIPDVVVSGINKGYNISSDVPYSGTCGAACEGAMNGYKSIAVSAEVDPDDIAITKAAEFLANNIETLAENIPEFTFLNINVPTKGKANEWGPARLAYFGHDNLINKGEKISDKITVYHSVIFDEHKYRSIVTEPSKEEEQISADCELVSQGKIAISVIHLTPRTFSSKLKNMKLK